MVWTLFQSLTIASLVREESNNISKCCNNDLQHGKFKVRASSFSWRSQLSGCLQALEVKEGAFGLGLFLLEPAKAGDLIGGASYTKRFWTLDLWALFFRICWRDHQWQDDWRSWVRCIKCYSYQTTNGNRVQTRHLGRNYLFALNAVWTIDAAVVGNETRFINHAQGSSANCRAEGTFTF